MIKRFDKRSAYRSFVEPAFLYLSLSYLSFYFAKEYGGIEKDLIVGLALIGSWRYSFMLLNYIRALIYAYRVYPSYLKRIESLPDKEKYPKYIYFVIPSYKEDPWVSVEVFQSILADVNTIDCIATLIVSTGSDFDDQVIRGIYESHPNRGDTKLIFQRQFNGKRIAMGHALRVVARDYHKHGQQDSITLFMDGDTYIPLGTLKKSLPIFAIEPNLGAVTTNEVAYINSKSKFYKDWFNLKFAQRHILFQSQSISKRVLTLTGRFSIFRTPIVVTEDFISNIENDIIIDPAYGKFRFLMGDDKSSWYNLMKNGWEMLYLPDVLVYSLESRDGKFLEVSKTLPYRWYGNTLRNNARARRLKNQPLFIKYLFFDQLALMWTSLVGIVASIIVAIFIDFAYLPLYISWVLLVRVLQMSLFVLSGHLVSIRTVPLMLYSQWIGALIKIKAFYHLSDQKWSKGGTEVQTANGDIAPIKYPKAHYLSPFRMYLTVALFLFAMFTIYTEIISLPSAEIISSHIKNSTTIRFNATTDDGIDDGIELNRLIALADDNSTILLPSGTLDIYEPIVIKRDNITIEGDNTILLSHIKGKKRAVVEIEGSRGKYIGKILQNMRDHIHIKAKFKYQPKKGDLLLIEQKNDKDFVFKTLGSKKWYKKYPKIRSEIVEVADISNNILTISFYSKSMIDKKASIYKIDNISNVTLKNLTIDSIYKSKKFNHIYKNSKPDNDIDGIKILYASHITLKDISIYNSGSSPLIYERSYGCLGDHITIDGAINKGKRGHGYLRINKSFHIYLSHISVKNIRHIVFQWASAYNTIDHLYSEVDVNFHGGGTHHNHVTNVKFGVDKKYHKWGKVFITPDDASWAPPDFKSNKVEEIE
jgi:glycosyltransferase Alg8